MCSHHQNRLSIYTEQGNPPFPLESAKALGVTIETQLCFLAETRSLAIPVDSVPVIYEE